MATKKDSNVLITNFLKAYKAKYGTAPTNFNRYAKKWGFTDMLDDLGFERSNQIIEYFFELTTSHDAEVLLRNYGSYNESYEEAQADAAKRAVLAEETRKRVEEYRARK